MQGIQSGKREEGRGVGGVERSGAEGRERVPQNKLSVIISGF